MLFYKIYFETFRLPLICDAEKMEFCLNLEVKIYLYVRSNQFLPDSYYVILSLFGLPASRQCYPQ